MQHEPYLDRPAQALSGCQLVFLDFDGVLHGGLAGNFVRLPLFEQFLREHPTVVVVFSTTWRLTHPFEDLRDYFAPDVRQLVVGATPALPDTLPTTRWLEIRHWLACYGAAQLPWAALDDRADLFPADCPQLVLCESHKGLRPVQLQQLALLLGFRS